MIKEVVTLEVAQADVKRWLDLKKIGDQKREDKKDGIDTLVSATIDGTIVIEDDCTITHKLKFPTLGDKNEIGIDELKYKARISTAQLQAALRGSKTADPYAIVIALVAVLSGEPKGVIVCLDTEDMAIGSAIANFFL